MKKTLMTIAVIFCAAIAITLTSCKKDAEDLIIGEWNYVNAEITTSVSGLTGMYAIYNSDTTEIEEPEEGELQTMTFRKDGTVSTYIVEKGEEPRTQDGTYVIDGENLAITYDESTENFKFVVDKKNLTLTMEDTNQLEFTEDQVATVHYIITMNFNKK